MGRDMDAGQTLGTIEAALGPALALREVRRSGRLVAAIGRWRHAGAELTFENAETVQVIFNVSGGQRVEWQSHDRCSHGAVRAGTVAIASPGRFARVRVSGPADTVQVILSREMIRTPITPSAPSGGDGWRSGLQGAAAKALVALGGASGEIEDMGAIVDAVAALLTETAHERPIPRRGGLSPGAARRVRALLEPPGAAKVEVLAQAAGVSVFHFIRAFRASTGQTPHAWQTARRLDYAMGLLLEAGPRIGDVAEAAGFSSPSHFVSVFRQRLGVTPGAVVRAVALGG